MEDPKQLLYEMILEEFTAHPNFALARNIFLFCHFNPTFEMPYDVTEKFIQGLMEENLRAFSLTYPMLGHNKVFQTETEELPEDIKTPDHQEKRREIYNEVTAEYLSKGTGRTYTQQMVEDIPKKFRSITSYNEILELFIMASAQRRSINWELTEFTDMLQSFPIFSTLSEKDLHDLFTLLQFRRYNPDEIILRKDAPGTHLYIILTGKVEVVGENNESITLLETGSVFGEMSLLTGAPVSTSVYSRGVTKLATLTIKDFKHVLHRYPALHVFFYGLLIERTAKLDKKVIADINAGMTGDIANIQVIELFQMINSSRKTGTVELKLHDGNAKVYFNEGELVYADYGDLHGRQAIFSLFGVTQGQFVFSSRIPHEAEKYEIIGGFMGLVMEGMQRLDEGTDQPN